jgi:biopolymer transport protein ExbB
MGAAKDFFIGEWYFALPLVVMSLVAASLVIWRLLLNKSAATDMDDFLPVFQQTLREHGFPEAIALCKEEKGHIPNLLFVAGLEAQEQGVAAMKRSMANATELEIVPRLHFLLAPILAVAKIATMVGLFFTVISMINTFDALGSDQAKTGGGAREIGGHSKKIGLALFATALGLFTAIPLVFSHVLFKDWITRFENKIKVSSQKLIILVTNYKKDPSLLDVPEEAEEPPEEGEEGDQDEGKGKKKGKKAPAKAGRGGDEE